MLSSNLQQRRPFNALPRSGEADCPYVDQDDMRCRSHFSLIHLRNTFATCLGGGHWSCPIYYALTHETGELAEPADAAQLVCEITLRGKRLDRVAS